MGSLDLYSRRLAENLPVMVKESNLYQVIKQNFTSSPLRFSSIKHAYLIWRTSRMLNSNDSVPLLPNQHLGRIGYLMKKPFIITVHDIIRYLDVRRYVPLIQKLSKHGTFWLHRDYAGIRKACRIIVPSNHTRMDLVNYLGLPEEKITVVYHGIDKVFRPRRGSRPCDEPYILYVGTEQPRKNLVTLLKAFKMLKRDPSFNDLRLVKVGNAGSKIFRKYTLNAIRELDLEDDVILTGWVREEELVSFYSQAELLAFPSLYEGFGWPPLEAMACSCPVVSSNRTSMPEILGNAALFVEPCDVEAWRDAMFQVITNEGLRSRLIELGRRRASAFTWEKCTQRTLEVYRDVIEGENLRVLA